MAIKKLIIATGIYPPEVGGPAYYAKSLVAALERQGIKVTVKTYRLERRLPTGIRHLWFFLRLLPSLLTTDGLIALDTFSVGLPAAAACWLFKKKMIIRIGGDFLWEQYVESRREPVTLSTFYEASPLKFSIKEKLIFSLTKWTLRKAHVVVFSTAWQADIWQNPYGFSKAKVRIIENNYDLKGSGKPSRIPVQKTYLWAGRPIYLKNVFQLEEAFRRINETHPELKLKVVTDVSQSELFREMDEAYAVILPSLSDISPNFVLEAMMRGKPAIVTTETGIKDRLGNVALLIDPLNPASVEEAVIKLADEAEYKKLLERLDSFSFIHTYDDIAQEFLTLFT